jgi:pimeloyl-ACP methyl ester carboxylesterase
MSAQRNLALAALSAAAAAWEVQRRVDRRRTAADPAGAALNAPLEGRELEVVSADGTALHARDFGPADAPAVVLVHGWTEAIEFWTLPIQALSRDLRVIAYDLRGHGRSATPADPDYSTDAFAADLDAVLRAAIPEGERAVVAGHSLGAMTIAAWAGAHRDEVADRIAAAALINTGMGDLITETLLLRTPKGLDGMRRAVGRRVLSASAPLPKVSTPVSARAIQFIALGPDASPAEVEFCERLILSCRRDVRAACGDTLSQVDLHEDVASISVPTTVIAGGRDRLTPVPHARRMVEALPRVERYVELPRCGHMAAVEEPEAVGDALRELVEKHLLGRARSGQPTAAG